MCSGPVEELVASRNTLTAADMSCVRCRYGSEGRNTDDVGTNVELGSCRALRS
ncbi:hypothetical protein BDZ89DRAFT_512695 [Hymenopellis radicata]|nr:hypothetical protein BDZ89DRAFT_512695 [Hymenopellis radicata]